MTIEHSALRALIATEMFLPDHPQRQEAYSLARDILREQDDNAAAFDRYREAAVSAHGAEGECEIDDNAPVSKGDYPGAYVQAWVWVSDEDCANAT